MKPESFLNGRVKLFGGDNRDVLKHLPDNSIDSICTDPPYALVSIQKRFGKPGSAPVRVDDVNASGDLKAAYARASAGFMGKQWDTGEVAFDPEFWAECLRVLKPGGHLVAFSGTRTYHRMTVAIEDAGFEVRDQIGWTFGSGFPKSHDISKAVEKVLSGEEYPESTIERIASYYGGLGTALKPAWEPICLARKPLSEKTIALNTMKWGVGAINVDGCRIETAAGDYATGGKNDLTGTGWGHKDNARTDQHPQGRWPANIVHDGSYEVLAAFPDADGAVSNGRKAKQGIYEDGIGAAPQLPGYADTGSAARFFYTAKADSDDRLGSKHPTVKPVDLMQWLCRLVTPKGGTILDPFAGTGTTGEAAFREGFNAILIEREEEYQADIRRRMALVLGGPDERKRESIKAKMKDKPVDAGPLFGGAA